MTLKCGNMSEEKGGDGCDSRMAPGAGFSFWAVATLWYDSGKVTSPPLGLGFYIGLYQCPRDHPPQVSFP